MRIEPDVSLLRSMRDGGPIDYTLLAGEAIDNALDAGAGLVELVFGDDAIRIKDDGAGISQDRLVAIATLGRHGPMETSRLGRFGVGIKIQALRTGDLFEVLTVSRDGSAVLTIDWGDLLRSGKWEIADARRRPVAVGTPTFTQITIAKLREAPAFLGEELRLDIAARFHPAIAAGTRIAINGADVEALSEPAMRNVVDCQLQLSAGRGAHVRGGILLGRSALRQVHVGFRHRVIMPGSRLGCGNYAGVAKLFARVQLSGPWHLGQFKNELPDEGERRELDEAVLAVLLPLLEECQGASMSARLERITDDLNDSLPEDIAARPKRAKKKEPPTAGVKRAKRPHGEVAPEKSTIGGPAKSKRPRAKLSIVFEEMGPASVGAFDSSGRDHCVILSIDHPDVARFIEHRDYQVGLASLRMMALMIYVQGVILERASGKQPELPDFGGTFGEQVSRLLALQGHDEMVETK